MKGRAAAEGKSVQACVQAAIDAWQGQASSHAGADSDWQDFLERYRGSLAGTGDWNQERHEEKRREWRQDRMAGVSGKHAATSQ